MSGLPNDTARLVGLFVGCVLYGVLCITFVICLSFIVSASRIPYVILVAAMWMFFISTFSVILSLKNVLDGFIYYQGPGGALAFYATQNGGWTHWMPTVHNAIQTTTGDALLVHRCHLLYESRWEITAFPFILWLASTGTSVIAALSDATLTGSENINSNSVFPFISATVALTLTTNIITTYLILRRLMTIQFDPELQDTIRPYSFARISVILVESGLVYTVSMVISLGIFLSGSNFKYVSSLAVRRPN
ncbi:hypothetical protein B0H14DRAFT_2342023 [Mycena olivaceomarginata]|nr:hypothetical protein B0H14DRAFT_2355506 [Mycena olivaceomarginata]KAJ7878331.1 hypothetical protein B0H14DRAFT_2342023 [Mycena olivaceomarginata]